MRIEPYGSGSIVHIVKRGARGAEIVRDIHDRERFLDTLYFLNDSHRSEHWIRETMGLSRFTRPDHWPERDPLIDVLAWTLLDNHLHLLARIREEKEDGLPEFARRIFRSMTGHFNEKYDEKGSIFQGPYKSKTVDSDEYLRYVIPYIMVKNTFEMHPDGFDRAVRDFDQSWLWAIQYPYSSLGAYALADTVSARAIAEQNIIHELFPTPQDLKEASRDMLESYRTKRDDLRNLQLEE